MNAISKGIYTVFIFLLLLPLTSAGQAVSTAAGGNNRLANIITPLCTPSISITTPSNFVCLGEPATFTATTVNGGTAPVYQWKVNGLNTGPNSAVYTYIPAHGDAVSCMLTSNDACASPATSISNIITMIALSPILVTSFIVATPNDSVCAYTTVTFTGNTNASGATGQWKVNGINVGSVLSNPL